MCNTIMSRLEKTNGKFNYIQFILFRYFATRISRTIIHIMNNYSQIPTSCANNGGWCCNLVSLRVHRRWYFMAKFQN